MTSAYTSLPDDLPIPVDDGAADHLTGMRLPSIGLASTKDDVVDLARLPGRSVVFAYPMTGRPGVALPEGWDAIPGARGCTPQACGFRDHADELKRLGARVLGLSTQGTDVQRELVERLHLPFALLSDDRLALARALNLPTFMADGIERTKRLTLVIDDGRITHVFYPVFPPDRSAAEVVAWLTKAP